MPTVTLREVTRENWRQCVGLKVAEGQARFVAPNTYSLAEAAYEPGCVPLAVYADGEMVGFTMYELLNGGGYILRLMVAEAHQRKGYGRAAMEEVIRILKAKPECRRIRTSYVPDNDHAAALYHSLGFRDRGERDQGEIVVELPDGASVD